MSAQVRAVEVHGYRLLLDRWYDPDTHVWVRCVDPEGGCQAVRIGMDPLGVETSGTLAQLSFLPIGTQLRRGQSYGQLEAAKFVGPLTTPVSGVIEAVNQAVLDDPGWPERDPFDAGWLVELRPSALREETAGLLRDESEIVAWFARAVEDYRLKGVIAQ